MNISKEQPEALEKVVAYLWADEKRNFEKCTRAWLGWASAASARMAAALGGADTGRLFAMLKERAERIFKLGNNVGELMDGEDMEVVINVLSALLALAIKKFSAEERPMLLDIVTQLIEAFATDSAPGDGLH